MVMPGRPAQPLAGHCTGVAPPRSIESSLPARAGACRPPPAPPNRRSRPHMSANQPTSASHNQLDTKAQAWSALFEEPMSDLVKRYTSSVFFDKRLWQADITGSLAHAEMLAAQGDRKSTRLNSSHLVISYAVFCLKKKKDLPAVYRGRLSVLRCPASRHALRCI